MKNKINPDTPRRFTGIYDVNKNPICEGDIIVRTRWGACLNALEFPHEVVWSERNGRWVLRYFYGDVYPLYEGVPFKIIGNIHDNPEVLKK